MLDIDPGPEITWADVIAAARLVRRQLEGAGLESFVKTTGGRGLHVVVPLQPSADWSDCLAFSRGLAEAIAAHDPARYTTRFAKAGRERKILIDYLRNNRTNTSIAAFSMRAKPARAGVDAARLVGVSTRGSGPRPSPSRPFRHGSHGCVAIRGRNTGHAGSG